MLGVVNDAPVANDVPPVNAEYQLIVPALAVAPNAAVPVPHMVAGVLAVMVGIAFTVAATDVLAAVVQPFAVASTK
jgi:predicted membrane protein